MNTDTILLDFDQEVKNRCELIRVNAENVSANLQSALDLTLLAIPEYVRKMPVKELMEKYNGDIQKAASMNAVQKSPPSSPRRKGQSPMTTGNNSKKVAKKETPTQQKSPAVRSKTPKQVPAKSPNHLTPSHQVIAHATSNISSTPRGTPRSKPSPKSPKFPATKKP